MYYLPVDRSPLRLGGEAVDQRSAATVYQKLLNLRQIWNFPIQNLLQIRDDQIHDLHQIWYHY